MLNFNFAHFKICKDWNDIDHEEPTYTRGISENAANFRVE